MTCDEARDLDHWLADCSATADAMEAGSLSVNTSEGVKSLGDPWWLRAGIAVLGVVAGGMAVAYVKD